MNEEQIRQLIREEMRFMMNDKYVFDRLIQVINGTNIQLGRSVGTKIGTEGGSTGQKLGFFGVDPVLQLDTLADPSGGATVDTQARSSITQIIDALQLIGLMQ